MRFGALMAVVAVASLAGALAGGGLALSRDSAGDGATTASLVDVSACPGANGALGQLKRGMPVLITAVYPGGDYLEISYPLSPNGRGWLPTADIEVNGDLGSLPSRVCLPIAPAAIPTAPPAATTALETPSPTATAPRSPTRTPTPSPSPTATPTSTASPTPSPTPIPPSPTPVPPTSTPLPPTSTPVPPSPTPVPPSPTPGDTQAPAISQGQVTPPQINGPNPTQKCPPRAMVVAVSANVADNAGVTQVTVSYSVKSANGLDTATMTLVNGRYTATIGPFNPVQTAVVTFTVTARDAAGNQSSLLVGSTTLNACQ